MKTVGIWPFIAAALIVAQMVGIACSARETAKDAYTVQQKACEQAYDEPAKQRECVEYVRNRWTEAGAPPAAQGDAGHE